MCAESERKVQANDVEKFVEIKILDKVSSKNSKLEVEIGKEAKFKNLLIKALKCKNSEFLHLNALINKFLNFVSLPN